MTLARLQNEDSGVYSNRQGLLDLRDMYTHWSYNYYYGFLIFYTHMKIHNCSAHDKPVTFIKSCVNVNGQRRNNSIT